MNSKNLLAAFDEFTRDVEKKADQRQDIGGNPNSYFHDFGIALSENMARHEKTIFALNEIERGRIKSAQSLSALRITRQRLVEQVLKETPIERPTPPSVALPR